MFTSTRERERERDENWPHTDEIDFRKLERPEREPSLGQQVDERFDRTFSIYLTSVSAAVAAAAAAAAADRPIIRSKPLHRFIYLATDCACARYGS